MSILKSLWKFKRTEKECRILLLGLDNAGKTSITRRICDLINDIAYLAPTQGFAIKSLVLNGLSMKIWDIGGEKSIRAYWKNYFPSADAIIYVIDSSDRRRIEESGLELQKLLEEDKLSGIPLLILANKQDLLHALSIQDLSAGLNLHNIRDRKWQIIGSSCRNGDGLQDGFNFIVEEIQSSNKLRRINRS